MEFDTITFDCYGTLIDWESGIRAGFRHIFRDARLSGLEESKLVEFYQEEEKIIELEKPFRPYRKVLAEAASAAGRKLGKNVLNNRALILAEELPGWLPFPDTNPALVRLAKKHRLGILSNIDNDLLSGTLKHFPVSFDPLVTAEDMKSYKPGPKHFEQTRQILGKERWLHVAASMYHDIQPATKLGISVVWVNRKNSDEGYDYAGEFIGETGNLAQLADWLEVS